MLVLAVGGGDYTHFGDRLEARLSRHVTNPERAQPTHKDPGMCAARTRLEVPLLLAGRPPFCASQNIRPSVYFGRLGATWCELVMDGISLPALAAEHPLTWHRMLTKAEYQSWLPGTPARSLMNRSLIKPCPWNLDPQGLQSTRPFSSTRPSIARCSMCFASCSMPMGAPIWMHGTSCALSKRCWAA